jgi:hypothetical protein
MHFAVAIQLIEVLCYDFRTFFPKLLGSEISLPLTLATSVDKPNHPRHIGQQVQHFFADNLSTTLVELFVDFIEYRISNRITTMRCLVLLNDAIVHFEEWT